MSSTIPSSSKAFVRRKLLQHTPIFQSNGPVSSPVLVNPNTPATISTSPISSFDANVVMILAILLFALICALGLNSLVRCILRCTSRIAIEPEPSNLVRLATVGVRRKALRALPIIIYSPDQKLNGSGSECAICISDLVIGERVRVLPKCGHGFHVRCIDRWLMARPSCPTCRQCVFTTAQRSSVCVEAGQVSGDTGSESVVHTIIVPLAPESIVHSLNVV